MGKQCLDCFSWTFFFKHLINVWIWQGASLRILVLINEVTIFKADLHKLWLHMYMKTHIQTFRPLAPSNTSARAFKKGLWAYAININIPCTCTSLCLFEYCKFRNFREKFIFANSVQRHICHCKNSPPGHDLPTSVIRIDWVISPFREGLLSRK